MIEYLHLTNFRRFDSCAIHLRRGNILVGPNNSGKSSILDALRVLDTFWRRTYNRNPELVTLPSGKIHYGYVLPLSSLPVNILNIVRNYDDDAVIEVRLQNKTKAFVRLHPDRQARFYIDARADARLNSSSRFRRTLNLEFITIPTLAPLETVERRVEDATVQPKISGFSSSSPKSIQPPQTARTLAPSSSLESSRIPVSLDTYDDAIVNVPPAW